MYRIWGNAFNFLYGRSRIIKKKYVLAYCGFPRCIIWRFKAWNFILLHELFSREEILLFMYNEDEPILNIRLLTKSSMMEISAKNRSSASSFNTQERSVRYGDWSSSPCYSKLFLNSCGKNKYSCYTTKLYFECCIVHCDAKKHRNKVYVLLHSILDSCWGLLRNFLFKTLFFKF